MWGSSGKLPWTFREVHGKTWCGLACLLRDGECFKLWLHGLPSSCAGPIFEFLIKVSLILLYYFFQGSLLFCDACDKGYHMQCHVPPLETMPIGKIFTIWFCINLEIYYWVPIIAPKCTIKVIRKKEKFETMYKAF